MKAAITPKYNRKLMGAPKIDLFDTPLVISIWASGLCNFKCNYCIQSAEDKLIKKSNIIKQNLSLDTFFKLVEQLKQFPKKIMTALFCGIGEPLLNKDLPQMISFLKTNNIANRVEVTTNGSLLTEKLSLELINSGLDQINISIQGITARKYKSVCNQNINIDKLIKNITFFYNNKNNCAVHIKTVNTALDADEDKIFFDMFGDICDTINIDNITPLFKYIDYSNIIKENKNQYSNEKLELNEQVYCNLIFMALYILPNGDIVPCCLAPEPLLYGNINTDNLVDIWNSEKRKEFLKLHLLKKRYENEICKACIQPNIVYNNTDIEDNYTNEILNKLK